MIYLKDGNLLEARTEALVNTVNTVGVMGKGIALMFKERFPANYSLYRAACKRGEVRVGKMFISTLPEGNDLRWIVNFPTKEHWRDYSRIEWIIQGLRDLKEFLIANKVQSIAIPPLGAGNGSLPWDQVKFHIQSILSDLQTDIYLYQPSNNYFKVETIKKTPTLTAPRALLLDILRQYSDFGIDCSVLELHKLAWFLSRAISRYVPDGDLQLDFCAHKYGPYSDKLRHLIGNLEGSFILCSQRINDARPLDPIRFNYDKLTTVSEFVATLSETYQQALEKTSTIIEGFQSPFGMELLATVDWLIFKEQVAPEVSALRRGLLNWKGDPSAPKRKNELFDDREIAIALQHLTSSPLWV
jgi:O-acetyl-ADP-ribose deacetylase (regulator of RNase III)